MRIEFNKKDLQEAIAIASISLSSNGKDISSHYLFRVFNDTVEVLTYSGRLFSSTPLKAKVENAIDHNQFTIEAKRLKMWLQSVNDGDQLAFEFNGTHLKAISPKGTGKYQSQDVALFPFWDSLLVDSKETLTIESSRLHSAFSYAKFFVSDQESRSPHLCVVEFKNGSLYASDQVSVCLIQMPSTSGSSLRIHGKDLPGVLSYISNFEGNLTILEHDRAAFIKSPSGHIFGISKFNSAFPELNIPIDSQDTQTWTFSKMDFLTGIQFLSSCAAWEDTKLTVEAQGVSKTLTLRMRSSGGETVEYPIALTNFESQLGDSSLFQVSHPYLQKALSHFVGDEVSMGVNPKGKGGWLRFKETKNQDKYLTIVAWLM